MGICLGTDDVGKSSNRKNSKYSILSVNDNNINAGTYLLSITDNQEELNDFSFLNNSYPQLYDAGFIRDQFGTYINKHLASHKKLYNKMEQFNSKNHTSIEGQAKKIQKQLQSSINRDNPFFTEFKYSIRLSPPLNAYKDIIKKVFEIAQRNQEQTYSIIKETLFEYTDPNSFFQCPLFSNEKQYSNLEDNMRLIYLNPEGILAMERILWILKECDTAISYNPIIKYTIQFLLCFFTEHEVYFMVKSLVDDSISLLNSDLIGDDIARKLKFHFFFDIPSYEQFCEIFRTRLITSNKRMKLMDNHLTMNLGTNLSQVFSDLFQHVFYPSLPLIGHFQMMLLFIKEGLRIFHCVGYALLDYHYKKILDCQTSEEIKLILSPTPIEFITSLRKLRAFFKFGFNNKLKRCNAQKLKPQSLKSIQNRQVMYYRPKLRETSYILKYRQHNFVKISVLSFNLIKENNLDASTIKIKNLPQKHNYQIKQIKQLMNQIIQIQQLRQDYIITYYFQISYIKKQFKNNKKFENIWKWLPHHQKLQNPVQIYSTQIDGYSLKYIYLKVKDFKNMPMLLIIKTQNTIFGAYCDRMLNLKENKVYYGSNESFVFQIEPNLIPYYSTQINQNHIYVDHEFFSIGSDSAAIIINEELKGKTFKSETYNNKPLNDADPDDYNACSFDALELEIYTLHFI